MRLVIKVIIISTTILQNILAQRHSKWNSDASAETWNVFFDKKRLLFTYYFLLFFLTATCCAYFFALRRPQRNMYFLNHNSIFQNKILYLIIWCEFLKHDEIIVYFGWGLFEISWALTELCGDIFVVVVVGIHKDEKIEWFPTCFS